MKDVIQLTRYSTGSGCGCKLSPATLDTILKGTFTFPDADKLIVGNSTHDDAAVYDMGNSQYLIFTTDFFTPIVDDPFDFGYIAAVNAINDVYAMGGKPLLAVAILGWPINRLKAEEARRVVEGGRAACKDAGIPLAGGHSIENPEPLFGLAVNGLVEPAHLRTNSSARAGDLLFLTKSLGSGLLATAEKNVTLRGEDKGVAAAEMKKLNLLGMELGKIPAVHALTDVTGFGLLGHLLEICRNSGVSAELDYGKIHQLTDLAHYVANGSIAGGLTRNLESYGGEISPIPEPARSILADPQTAGGLLFTVDPLKEAEIVVLMKQYGLEKHIQPIGKITERAKGKRGSIRITVQGVENMSGRTFAMLDPQKYPERLYAEPTQSKVFPGARADCSNPIPTKGSWKEMRQMMSAFFADLWKNRKRLGTQSWIQKFAEKKGYSVNPHLMFQYNLRLWLLESEDAFGKRYCPCFEPCNLEEINKKMICPCEYIDADIEDKGTCHCTLFGRKDLSNEDWKAAEARLMREYRVELKTTLDVLDTSGMPLDRHRGLKVPDSYHLTKRGISLYGLPLQVYTETAFEAENLRKWAAYKGWETQVRDYDLRPGFLVTISPSGTP